jgi:hypothetical protein
VKSIHAMQRRKLMLAAALTPVLPLPFGPARAFTPPPGGVRAVFDERFPQSVAFADRARGWGATPFGFPGDISTLWFEKILPALDARPMPLVGLTNIGALFCFEQLAWNAGMRVRLRIDHREDARSVRHIASVDMPAAMRARLEGAGHAFGRHAADAALACRPMWGDCTHAAVPEADAPGTQALVTWVIAPLNDL